MLLHDTKLRNGVSQIGSVYCSEDTSSEFELHAIFRNSQSRGKFQYVS